MPRKTNSSQNAQKRRAYKKLYKSRRKVKAADMARSMLENLATQSKGDYSDETKLQLYKIASAKRKQIKHTKDTAWSTVARVNARVIEAMDANRGLMDTRPIEALNNIRDAYTRATADEEYMTAYVYSVSNSNNMLDIDSVMYNMKMGDFTDMRIKQWPINEFVRKGQFKEGDIIHIGSTEFDDPSLREAISNRIWSEDLAVMHVVKLRPYSDIAITLDPKILDRMKLRNCSLDWYYTDPEERYVPAPANKRVSRNRCILDCVYAHVKKHYCVSSFSSEEAFNDYMEKRGSTKYGELPRLLYYNDKPMKITKYVLEQWVKKYVKSGGLETMTDLVDCCVLLRCRLIACYHQHGADVLHNGNEKSAYKHKPMVVRVGNGHVQYLDSSLFQMKVTKGLWGNREAPNRLEKDIRDLTATVRDIPVFSQSLPVKCRQVTVYDVDDLKRTLEDSSKCIAYTPDATTLLNEMLRCETGFIVPSNIVMRHTVSRVLMYAKISK